MTTTDLSATFESTQTGSDGRTVVEAVDPDAMARLEDSTVVREVADEARQRLRATLESLGALAPARVEA